MLIQGQVGPSSPQSLQVGTNPTLRLGQTGEAVVSELHGRFYEQVYRGGTFRFGTNTIVAATAVMSTATAINTGVLATTGTAVPMLGIYNPPTSSVNVVMLQSQFNPLINNATSPQPFGALVWCSSVGNGNITLGQQPYNSKTLTNTGSQVRAFNGWQTIAGISSPLTLLEPADFQPGGGTIAYGTVGTTAMFPSYTSIQNFDGQLIVPPGGFLGLFGNISTTTFSFTGRMLWEEVPV